MKSLRIANFVIEKLKKNNYEAYYVGGCVRDHLLGLPINDIDITTSALPYQVLNLFRAEPTGAKYGTVTITDERINIEVTTFRTEEGYADFRRPDTVQFTVDVLEDLKRRDFTINGLIMDERNKIYDYVDGLKDLKAKVIRAIGDANERFNEDALRLLRAIYFQAKLGFEIEEETFLKMKENAHLITHLPNERIHSEMLKILKSKHQVKAIKSLRAANLHKYIPGFEKGIEYITDNIDFHLYNDAFFSLVFSFNKGVPKEWKFSNLQLNRYQKVVKLVNDEAIIDDFVLFEYGLEISVLANRVLFLLNKQQPRKNEIEKMFLELSIKSITDLNIRGSDILKLTDKKQGAWLKKILDELIYLVLSKKLKNKHEDLINYCKERLDEK